LRRWQPKTRMAGCIFLGFRSCGSALRNEVPLLQRLAEPPDRIPLPPLWGRVRVGGKCFTPTLFLPVRLSSRPKPIEGEETGRRDIVERWLCSRAE